MTTYYLTVSRKVEELAKILLKGQRKMALNEFLNYPWEKKKSYLCYYVRSHALGRAAADGRAEQIKSKK